MYVFLRGRCCFYLNLPSNSKWSASKTWAKSKSYFLCNSIHFAMYRTCFNNFTKAKEHIVRSRSFLYNVSPKRWLNIERFKNVYFNSLLWKKQRLGWQRLSCSTYFVQQNTLNFDPGTRPYSNFRQKETSATSFLQGLSNNQLLVRNVRRTTGHQDYLGSDSVRSTIKSTMSDVKLRVQARTNLLFNGKISKLKKSFILHKCQLKDKWKIQHQKSLQTVGKLKRTLKAKKENIKTIPNLLTTMRMASAPVLAYLVVYDYFGTACTIFVLAGITDLLDGYIARNFKNQRTALGTALDPLADKLLVSFLGISLTAAGLIPIPMTVLIISRDVGLTIASFYIRYISLPPPRTLSRYFDVSLVTAKLYPSTISKINTGLQLSYVAATLASPVFNFVDHPLLQGLMYLTAVTTAISGVDYVLTWRKRLKIIQK